MHVSPEEKLIKVDIKDYFMSGDQVAIANLASDLVPQAHRVAWRDIVEFMLLNQSVSFPGTNIGMSAWAWAWG